MPGPSAALTPRAALCLPDRDCVFLLDQVCGNRCDRNQREIYDTHAEEGLVVSEYVVAIIFAAPVSSISVIMYAGDG